MKRFFILLILIFAIAAGFLSGCGSTRSYSGISGSFEFEAADATDILQTPEPQEELSEEERFIKENTDEFLMWFNGRVIDLREIDPADYYATDEIMHRWRELYPFEPEKLLYETQDSSCFSRIGYDYSREALALEFRSTGKLYVCYGLSAEDWEEFRASESLGKYYNKNIKDEYYIELWDNK